MAEAVVRLRVEAIKVEQGFLIPFADGLTNVPFEKILLDIEVVEPALLEDSYAALDDLVGLVETGDTTASVEHDRRIYRRDIV